MKRAAISIFSLCALFIALLILLVNPNYSYASAMTQMPDTVGYSGLHIYDWGDSVPNGATPISDDFTVISSNTEYKDASWSGRGLNGDMTVNGRIFNITDSNNSIKVRWDHIGYYIDEMGARKEIGCTLSITNPKLMENASSNSQKIAGYDRGILISYHFYDSAYWDCSNWMLSVSRAEYNFSFFITGDTTYSPIDIDLAYITGTSIDYSNPDEYEYVAPGTGWTGEAYVPDINNTHLTQGTYNGDTNAFYNASGYDYDEPESLASRKQVTCGFNGDDIGFIFGSTNGNYGFEWEFSSLKSLSTTCAPTINKTVDGNKPQSTHIFNFTVQGITHSDYTKTISTDANGVLNIGNLENYSDRGEFIYRIDETTRAGYAAHAPVYLKVKVTANLGELQATYAFYSDSACSSSNVITSIDNHKLTKGIKLTKTANPTNIEGNNATPGNTITYTFNITNTGEADLSNVSISDELQGMSSITYNWANGNGVLKAGETITATATYSIKQSDIDKGNVINTATASGITVLNETAKSQEATVTTAIEQQPAISLDKQGDNTVLSDAHAGSSIRYTFEVRNTGNVTLHNVNLNDPMLGGNITLDKTTLAPNETATAEATYNIIQQDIENGNVNNTANTSGMSPSNETVSANDAFNVQIIGNPSVEFDKSVNKEELKNATAGDEIVYTFTVHNTGNTILTDLTVNDAMLGGNITAVFTKTTLQPGEKSVGSMRYSIKQADIDAGRIDNNASMTIASQSNSQTLNDEDNAVTNIDRISTLSFVKSADRDHLSNASAGDLINYSFTVINTGNTTIKNGTISDPLLGTIALSKTTLEPGEYATASKQYAITQDDIDSGQRENTATTQWSSSDGTNISKQSSWNIVIDRSPSITLDKSVIGDTTISNASTGDDIKFKLTVTNNGNTTLTGIDLTDELDGAVIDDTGMKTALQPGESTNAVAVYSLKQSDIDAGDVLNIAVVQAKTPDGCDPAFVTSSDDANVNITRQPSISLDKTAQPQQVENALPGDIVTYTFTIENNGNTTLSDLTLTDPKLGGDIPLDSTIIQPGESIQTQVEYRLTQSDIDSGNIHNEATVVSTAPQGSDIANPSATDTADVSLVKSPSLELSKNIIDGEDSAELEDHEVGDTISFEILIMNTGNTTLTNVRLNDEMLGGDIDLTEAEKAIDTSILMNYASDTDDSDETDGTENTSGNAYDDMTDEAQDAIDETDNDENDMIEHEYIVEHSELDESLPITTLLPGEYIRIVLPYTITQNDIDNGFIDNIANAFALPPSDSNGKQDELSATDEAGMPLPSTPSIEIVKTADVDSITNAQTGDIITYTMVITNNGNVSLKDINLIDELEGIQIDTSELNGINMAPGDSKTITATYAITQEDIDNGYVDNHAIVTARSVSDCISEHSEDTIRENNGIVQDDDAVSVELDAPIIEQENGVMDILLAQTGDDFRNGFIAVIAVIGIMSGIAIMLYNKRVNK